MTDDRQTDLGEVVLECSGLCKTFGTLMAVRDAALTLRRGQVLGLVGPNGAGKTTLMRMLATLLHPTRGEVRIHGLNALADPLPARRHIGYLPDFFNLPRDLTLAECLRFFAHAYAVPPEQVPRRVHDSLAATGLLEKENDLVRHLSRGMVQRLGMAMLAARDAEILILDEPASGLDPTARMQLRRQLKELGRQGKAVLISSHILNELEDACTHVAILHRGRLLTMGTLEEIRRRDRADLRYRIRILGPPEPAVAVAMQAGADFARADEGALLVDVPDEAAIARVNAGLVSSGLAVAELRLMSDLEGAFVQLTTGEEVQHVAQ